MKRCPNALAKQPFVLHAVELYGGWKLGLTPSGKGLAAETKLYRETMAELEQLEREAEAWYFEQTKKD